MRRSWKSPHYHEYSKRETDENTSASKEVIKNMLALVGYGKRSADAKPGYKEDYGRGYRLVGYLPREHL